MKTKISNLDAEESYPSGQLLPFSPQFAADSTVSRHPFARAPILLPLLVSLSSSPTRHLDAPRCRRGDKTVLSPPLSFFFFLSFSRFFPPFSHPFSRTSRATFSYNCSLLLPLSLSRSQVWLASNCKKRKERKGERKEIRWKKDPVGILFAASSIRLIVDTVPSKRRVHAHVRARARVYAVNVISNKQISGWLDVNHAREAIRLNFGLRDEFARILEVAYRASIERAARERAANEQIIRKAPRAGQMSVPPRGIRVACG